MQINRSIIRNRAIPSCKKQTGAALILSLVILVVMTLFGLAGMNTSIMQEKMAANALSTNINFQGAETAAKEIINDARGGQFSHLDKAVLSNKPIKKSDPTTVNLNIYGQTNSNYAIHLGEVKLPLGDNLDANKNSISITQNRFEIVGISNKTGSQAQTIVRQGIILK